LFLRKLSSLSRCFLPYDRSFFSAHSFKGDAIVWALLVMLCFAALQHPHISLGNDKGFLALIFLKILLPFQEVSGWKAA
jgi:hypothetical protein